MKIRTERSKYLPYTLDRNATERIPAKKGISENETSEAGSGRWGTPGGSGGRPGADLQPPEAAGWVF